VPNPEFADLQKRLRTLWPSVTLRSIGDVERTVVVVHSISLEVPDQLIPVFPAYEERFLCLVLSLLRSRNSRVIYVPRSQSCRASSITTSASYPSSTRRRRGTGSRSSRWSTGATCR